MKNTYGAGFSRSAAQIEIQKFKTITGKHVYGNLDDIQNKGMLTALDKITEIVIKAVNIGGMHIVDMIKYKFDSQGNGVSVIALLKESHLTVHTWPEGNYATVDIYSCGEKADPVAAFNYVVKMLNPRKCEQFYSDRSK